MYSTHANKPVDRMIALCEGYMSCTKCISTFKKKKKFCEDSAEEVYTTSEMHYGLYCAQYQ